VICDRSVIDLSVAYGYLISKEGICHFSQNPFTIEPFLQPLTGEVIELKIANHQNEAGEDIHT